MQECCLRQLFPKKSHGAERNKTHSPEKGAITFQQPVWSSRKEFTGEIRLN